MDQRPTFIDLGSNSQNPFYNGLVTPRALPSPRLHIAGDVPPELSPLDAFAAQSRLLAKQLKENANRESRLPPLALTSAFSQPRPGYLRSASADENAGPSIKPDVEIPDLRPISVYPQLSNILLSEGNRDSLPNRSLPNLASPTFPKFGQQDEERPRGRQPRPTIQDFGIRRELSPTPILEEQPAPAATASYFPSRQSLETTRQGYRPGMTVTQGGQSSGNPYFSGSRPSVESVRNQSQPRPSTEFARQQSHPRPSTESTRQQNYPRPSMESVRQNSQDRRFDGGLSGYDMRGLAPPRSPFAQKSPSIRSVSVDSEEDASAPTGASLDVRKLSTSSGLSSPISPFMHSVPRSPSISSDFSANGSRLSRPTFNFSRPLSRASETAFDLPVRQASSDSQPSFVLADDSLHTPVSMHGEAFMETDERPSTGNGAPSYVYSRFSLPRGKMLQRNSKIFQDTPGAEFTWEIPVQGPSNIRPFTSASATPPSPPSRPSTSSIGQSSITSAPEFALRRSEDTSNTARFNRSADLARADPAESISSGGTIKAQSQHSNSTSIEGSAEYHVTKGIECHENGSLNESTYHLRIAARQNHPTGMLLYALACRHGWGMRPNQKEGVRWLRKAADHAILEVADDEDTVKGGRNVDFLQQKTRKAQFALSIYELGVSHMNGWGIEQDKVLALRCFEIAGSWGDGDALAEAGFCYAQGVGCKKDLKKSAKFYRLAESKGISMVGNSWIYKSKYKDDADEISITPSAATTSPEKKKRDKSRTRTMFGRKKSNT